MVFFSCGANIKHYCIILKHKTSLGFMRAWLFVLDREGKLKGGGLGGSTGV